MIIGYVVSLNFADYLLFNGNNRFLSSYNNSKKSDNYAYYFFICCILCVYALNMFYVY